MNQEDLKQFWSEILAGKINNTNETCKRTMSTLSNLTSQEANLFKRVSQYNIDGCIFYSDNMPQDFPSEGKFLKLSDASLINQHNITLSRNIPYDPKLNIFRVGSYCDYMLYLTSESKKENLTMPCQFLTEAGTELAKFVQHQPNNAYLSCLSKFFKAKGCQLKKSKLDDNRNFEIKFSDEHNVA